MKIRPVCLAGIVFCARVGVGQATDAAPAAEMFFRAIRANELATLRKLAATPGAAKVVDRLQSTPLHYAATYGSAEAIRILLDGGEDPNARNNVEATPLVFAAWDVTRTRLLVEKGANVNARARNGVTPLLIAASVGNNLATVRYLLEKGASVNAAGPDGFDVLMTAAGKADPATVRLLLDHGADAHKVEETNTNALANALSFAEAARIECLLKAGSDVNAANTFTGRVKNGPLALRQLTPLMLAAPHNPPENVELLLKAGAQVNAVDCRKMNALMLAVATDHADANVAGTLITAGADVNARDQNGESVWDWAQKFRRPEILDALQKAGAKPGVGEHAAPVRPAGSSAVIANEAIDRATRLLAESSTTFFPAGGGCSGCHHQPLAARAFAAAREVGLKSDARLPKIFDDGMAAGKPRVQNAAPYLEGVGGDYDPYLSQVLAMNELGEPASPMTDMMVQYLVSRQAASGAWITLGIARPPLEDSTITRTAEAIQVIQSYGWPGREPEFRERIARGRDWLLAAKPATNYERAERLAGLHAVGVGDAELTGDVRMLLAAQKGDGGWAQTDYLDSDAYATGLVLRSLYKANMLRADDKAYQRGVQFLLRTQFPDGSWFVRSRAPKFQPYFQSGFPFDHDQWISAAATAWAVMALAPVAEHAADPTKKLAALR